MYTYVSSALQAIHARPVTARTSVIAITWRAYWTQVSVLIQCTPNVIRPFVMCYIPSQAIHAKPVTVGTSVCHHTTRPLDTGVCVNTMYSECYTTVCHVTCCFTGNPCQSSDCEDICLPSHDAPTGYRCLCRSDMLLNTDNRTCVGMYMLL